MHQRPRVGLVLLLLSWIALCGGCGPGSDSTSSGSESGSSSSSSDASTGSDSTPVDSASSSETSERMESAGSESENPDARPKRRLDISGSWRCWLDSPGGELPFGLMLAKQGGTTYRGVIVNGSERIAIPDCTFDNGKLVIDISHYDSKIEATIGDSPRGRFEGRWKKRRGVDRYSDMAFHAERGNDRRFPWPPDAAAATAFEGRWLVDFESSEDPAIGIFETGPRDTLVGTFLTTTGDYRYLAGAARKSSMKLSCFDGAHAFLFEARLKDDGTIEGDFWSSDSWHETWTASKNPDAALPDAYKQTSWTGPTSLGDVKFPDLRGTPRSLDDPEFAGKARILQVFGSWCPNCHDASDLLVKLHREYKGRGLSILGLAFEHTGDFDRDVLQVQRYKNRHDIEYPILLAGLSDKGEATKSLGLLDRVRSYPTTIFLDAEGNVQSIHTGFAGPATGAAYEEIVASFRSQIEDLLGDG